MAIFVHGIGWLTTTGYGSIRRGSQQQFAAGEGVHSLAKRGLFSQPFKNFGRLDGMSRLTVSAVALALQDAGIAYAAAAKQQIGIIGTSPAGSLQSDIDYYKDFYDNGRTLSRANLFIYTLPSSPLGEAAIHFGLVGPLLYGTGADGTFAEMVQMAADIVATGEAERMLVGTIVADEALYLLIDQNQDEQPLCTLDEAVALVAAVPEISTMISQLSSLKVQKGIA